MGNYFDLIAAINAAIKTNGEQGITGASLNAILRDMVAALGAGYQYVGVVAPDTAAPSTDYNAVYLGLTAGTYTNFGGTVVGSGQFGVFAFDGSWTYNVADIASDKYTKPSGGIPKTDLAQAVQTSLSKADVAACVTRRSLDETGVAFDPAGESFIVYASNAQYVEVYFIECGDDYTNVHVTMLSEPDTELGPLVDFHPYDGELLVWPNEAIDLSVIRLGEPGQVVFTNVADKSGADPMIEPGLFVRKDLLDALLAEKANVDGYYDTLVSGAAKTLVGHGSVPAEFMFRTSGGNDDIGTGPARIVNMKGNGVVWNQLVGADTSSVTITSGHKYYSVIGGVAAIATSDGTAIAVTGGVDIVIDLTLYFNGSVPENLTAEEFEAILQRDYSGLNYYRQNSGEVLPFKAQVLKTTGFNQWDEEWRRGYYDANGTYVNAPSGNYISNTNSIRVIPSTTYYAKHPITNLILVEKDATGNVLTRTNMSEAPSHSFTTGPDTSLIDFSVGSSSKPVTTYNHDICINLSWSGYRNGEYEQYKANQYHLDPTKFYGKLNGEGSLVQIYPQGMFKAGSAFDLAAMAKNECDVKLGKVDLGTLTWSYAPSPASPYLYPYFFAAVADSKKPSANTLISNTYARASVVTNDKAYQMGSSYLLITDSAYTDAATFKTAMSGVSLIYELATPLHYTDCIYLDYGVDTPLSEIASYLVDDFGTEEWLPANTDEPYTAPCNLDIQYPMNAVDFQRRADENFINKASLTNFLEALKTAGVIAAYTMTYNATTREYEFTITPVS